MTNQTTDTRALIAELVEALEYHIEQTRPIERSTAALTKALAALAQQQEGGE